MRGGAHRRSATYSAATVTVGLTVAVLTAKAVAIAARPDLLLIGFSGPAAARTVQRLLTDAGPQWYDITEWTDTHTSKLWNEREVFIFFELLRRDGEKERGLRGGTQR